MSFFSSLQFLKLSPEELKDLSERDIARIEKKLKAEARLGNFDLNSISTIISTLRNNKKEIGLLYNLQYKWFREVMKNPGNVSNFPNKEASTSESTEEFKLFVSENFQNEILDYVNLCLQENHFRGLHSFMHFSDIFSSEIIQEITEKLAQKLSVGFEYLSIHSVSLKSKCIYLINPFFFRCLNQIDKLQVEDTFVELIIKLSENLKLKNEAFQLQIAFSTSFFQSTREDVNRVCKSLKQRAQNNGIIEVFSPQKSPKGETIVQNKKVQQKGKNNYTTRRHKNTSNFDFRIIIFAVSLVFGLFRLANTCNKPSYNSNSSYFSDSSPSYINEKAEPMMRDFIKEAVHIQMGGEIIRSGMIPFSKRKIVFYPRPTTTRREAFTCTVKNTTNKHVVFVFYRASGYDFILLDPFETDHIDRAFKYFVVHKGKQPMAVSYSNRRNQRTNGFGFNDFEEVDLQVLSQLYKLPIENNQYGPYTVTIDDNFVNVIR